MNISIFLFEFKHFIRNKAKLFSYIFFMLLCIYSIYNGFEIMHKQINTISNINEKQDVECNIVLDWLEQKKGPVDKPWVNIEDPYWLIRSTPSFIVKNPSPLFPLGIGQAEQFGFYKKITRWSSTFDSDMAEEISNYERLINGNIDFSFLIIFLLPILLIILTYNIHGLEKDLNFNKLITIQNKKLSSWIINRLIFYVLIVLLSINGMILSVGLITSSFAYFKSMLTLILISNLYVIVFSFVFYLIIKNASSSSSVAFKMISFWLFFCVITPGSVHQYVSIKYPANYMTEFLDVNREQTYEVFKLDDIELYDFLVEIHPEIVETKKSQQDTLDSQLVRRCISTIINQMNIAAENEIEMQNEDKNNLIKSTYFFNPISYVQNLWNSCTATDYYSYGMYRLDIQESVISRNKLIVLELWNESEVDKEIYSRYLKILNN